MAPLSHALFCLPLEVTQVIVTLLETDDLCVLTQVCHAATSLAKSIPPQKKTLFLPPTDRERARRLIVSLSTRLAPFDWIQIASVWHVDLLVELAVTLSVHSICVKPVPDPSRAVVEAICERLPLFPKLINLNLSDTRIADLACVVPLIQLRSLQSNRTDVADSTPLASLVHLEELEMLDCLITEMSCITRMPNLRRFEVKHVQNETIDLTSLQAPNRLETLRAWWIGVNQPEFRQAVANLQHLTVCGVDLRSEGRVALWASMEWWIIRMERLETLHDLENPAMPPHVFRMMPNLLTTSNAPDNFDDLTPFMQLQELSISIPTYYTSEDFRGLLQLPNLKSVHIYREDHDYQLEPLLDVLSQLPQLESLHITKIVDMDQFDPLFRRFAHLKHLNFSVDVFADTLDCLRGYLLLQSLHIQVDYADTDISVIGSLTQLEELDLTARNHQFFSILTKLVRLKSLSIEGQLDDLLPLHDLLQLRTLTIISSIETPMKNHEILGRLTRLRKLDIQATSILDLSTLVRLHHLRTAKIPVSANCQVLVTCDHPSLLYVLHPTENCLWSRSCQRLE